MPFLKLFAVSFDKFPQNLTQKFYLLPIRETKHKIIWNDTNTHKFAEERQPKEK